jgi:hypothetical protein
VRFAVGNFPTGGGGCPCLRSASFAEVALEEAGAVRPAAGGGATRGSCREKARHRNGGFAVSLWTAYLEDIIFSFRKHKELAEKAFQQVDDQGFFKKPGEHSNNIAIIIKHVAGNLASRWTEFLTTDGDKPWRDRDAEFIIGPEDTRPSLVAAWEKAWAALLQTLAGLREEDLLKKVTIRREEHTVFQAIHRSLTHTAYHVGQIVYLSRLVTKEGWEWITIPPGQSQQWKDQGRKYLK